MAVSVVLHRNIPPAQHGCIIGFIGIIIIIIIHPQVYEVPSACLLGCGLVRHILNCFPASLLFQKYGFGCTVRDLVLGSHVNQNLSLTSSRFSAQLITAFRRLEGWRYDAANRTALTLGQGSCSRTTSFWIVDGGELGGGGWVGCICQVTHLQYLHTSRGCFHTHTRITADGPLIISSDLLQTHILVPSPIE